MITDDELRLYKQITGHKTVPAPRRFVPKPTDKDYKVGEMRRYFAQQTNQPNGEIVEISKKQHDSFRKVATYRTVSVRWKISGPVKDRVDEDTGEVALVGVKSSNEAATRNAAKIIPNIKRKLNNPLQLYRVM